MSNQHEVVVTDAADIWAKCAEFLRAHVSEAVWLTTFRNIQVLSSDAEHLRLAVDNPIIRDRIEGRYLSMVQASLRDAGREDLAVLIEVHAPLTEEALPGAPEIGMVGAAEPLSPDLKATAEAPDASLGQVISTETDPDGVDPRYTFESFVTGASNRFAHAAAQAVAEEPGRSYNPLFIHGGVGLGKTHLLHAIVHYVQRNYPGYDVRYVSTETFLNEFVEAIRTATTTSFKRQYRDIDILLVDDIQFMEGKEGLQEEFFHTFNSLHGARRQLVLSSDRPPRAIATLEDRLRSRFEWGLITDIQAPDLETRLAILRKKTELEKSAVPDDVLEFIATNITNNIRELEGALIRVSAFASLTHEPLTSELATSVLQDIVSDSQSKPLTVDLILEHTSEMFGFSEEDLRGKRRHRTLVNARQICMYVCRELTDLSYPAIAREFSNRDHTTVIHSVEKIKTLMAERHQIYDQVTALIQRIKAR